MSVDATRMDVAIVGGGAAGLSAALVLGRSRRRVVVFDEGKPRNAAAPHSYGFLGHDGISGAELLSRGRAEVAGYGVGIVDARVMEIAPADGDRFVLTTSAGTWEARAVILATGLADKLPRVAALLTQWSRDVTLISAEAASFDPEARARLDAVGVRVVAKDVRRFATDQGRLRAVVLADGEEIVREAIFVAMPTRAASDLASRLCDVDTSGFAIVDPEGRTSRPGVWAVGNATDRIAKLVHSAAAGSRAAASINAELFEKDIRIAMASASTAGG